MLTLLRHRSLLPAACRAEKKRQKQGSKVHAKKKSKLNSGAAAAAGLLEQEEQPCDSQRLREEDDGSGGTSADSDSDAAEEGSGGEEESGKSRAHNGFATRGCTEPGALRSLSLVCEVLLLCQKCDPVPAMRWQPPGEPGLSALWLTEFWCILDHCVLPAV